jgi:phosphatidylglycerophosphatase A
MSPVSDQNPSQPSGAATPITKWRSLAVRIFGTSFGFGYAPRAPGTWGTLPAVGAFLAVAFWAPAAWQTAILAGLLGVSCVGGVVLGNWAHAALGRKDPGQFTLDEVAGFLLTVLIFHPSGLMQGGGLAGLTVWAFVLTRIMDIIKPPPARQLEALSGGWGILMDDLMASLYAAGVLHAIYWAWPRVFQW